MLNLLYLLACIGGDAITTSHIHSKHTYPSPQLEQLKQHIFISATSFSTTTTMTTATAHPLNHSYIPHLFDVAVDVQPVGTSMVYQDKDKRTTAHRIDCGKMHSGGDVIPTPQIHGKPDCAISHSTGPSTLNNDTTTIAITTSSTISFSTTTKTTATAHHLAHSPNVYVICDMLGVQPDGKSVVYQFEDVFMAHRISINSSQQLGDLPTMNPIKDIFLKHQLHYTAHVIDGICTDGLDIAIRTMRIKFISIIFGTYDPMIIRLCTHSRPLRRLSTVSGELLLVVRESWLYPSFRGRVDTGCYRRIVHFALKRAIPTLQHHGVLATYTRICRFIINGELIFTQRWIAPFFLQSHDRIIQLESDQGIGLRANNRPDLAADISRSFSILKYRSIFWIILFCVCVCVLMTLFNFLRVAMHDLVLSF